MSLKELSSLNGVSGNEGEVRRFIIEQIKPFVDDIKVDTIGNIIAYKKGKKTEPKIMVSAHMDEVGLLVNSIDSQGSLGFTLVGDIDDRILVSKPVLVGDRNVKGVIGSKPIHLQKSAERKRSLEYNDLYIDIGTFSKEESKKIVSIGDYVSFKSDFIEFGDNLVKGKAIDNRAGCDILIDSLKKDSDVSFYAVFSVMKEIGIFGGQPATYNIDPDINIVLDSGLGNNKLGKGPILSSMEKGVFFHKKLTKEMINISNKKGISYQVCGFDDDKSDACKIQTSGKGSKTIKISIPCNYKRSPVTVVNKDDLKNTSILLGELLNNIGGANDESK